MNQPVVLEARGLSKTYPTARGGTLEVLRGVSFSVAAGATCAIVGKSGSGKTTLLGLCAGLDHPTQGEVILDGVTLSGMPEDERAQVRSEKIGFVFQNFQLIPTLTAAENVMVPLELRGEPGAQDRALELLRRVGLGDRGDHFPSQLSGGEQQRVALARAFIHRPRLLFADEPTGNLDSDTSHTIVDALFGLNAEAGTALVLVTHDLELAERTSQIIRLRGGAVV